MSVDAFKPVRDLEAAICEYTGAPYAVAVNSCTMALTLAVAWHLRAAYRFVEQPIRGDSRALLGRPGFWTPSWPEIEIPQRTYVSVPMAIIHAGGRPTFRDEKWEGSYQLKPLPVWDSARLFRKNLYHGAGTANPAARTLEAGGQMICTSFHIAKTLGDTQGGAILHDNPEADAWLRRARFDGRTEGVAVKDDKISQIGFHCYLSPDIATRLVWRLARLPAHNASLPWDDYPDLSTLEIFK